MNFDYIVNFIKSVLLISSIPITFLQLRKSAYDKGATLIEDVAKIVINRLYVNQLVSKEEIKGIIRSKSYTLRINTKLVLIDDIINKVIEKIEEIPFIEVSTRRRMLEGARLLRDGNESRKLKFNLFLKNNEGRIIMTILGLFTAFAFLFPDKWSLLSSVSNKKQIIIEFALSFIALLIVIFFTIGLRRIVYPNYDWGTVKILYKTFGLLPNFYDEKLIFTKRKEIFNYKLIDCKFTEQKKVVETDPSLLFGIAKMHKKHQIYNIEFQEEKNSRNKFFIQIFTQSFVNGGVDVQFMKYQIIENDVIEAEFSVPISTDEKYQDIIEKLPYLEEYRLQYLPHIEEGAYSLCKGHYGVILSKDKSFSGFIKHNDTYTLLK